MDNEGFGLEGELRVSRPQPRDELVAALAGEVRGASGRARQGRVGLWLAMTGLVIVSVASFGGISYASPDKSAAEAQYGPSTTPIETTPTPTTTTETPTTETPTTTTTAAAPVQATEAPVTQETEPFTPPVAAPTAVATPKAEPKEAQIAGQSTAVNVAPKAKSSQLPFTGLALWVPLAGGLALIAIGLVLRTRSRRPGSTAH
jgi:hypothetical protein